MTMRKKDYEAIARAFYYNALSRSPESNQVGFTEAWASMAHRIADYCATQDPTFKRDRFLADCGVSQS